MGTCDWFPMSRAEIRAWVTRHPEALPRTAHDLAAYPMAFRSVMVAMVPLDVRLKLWREHLESFLGPQSQLNATQRAFVKSTIPELPQLFGAPAPNPTILAWERRMATAFSRQEAAKLFKEIGPPEPPGGVPLPPDALPAPAV